MNITAVYPHLNEPRAERCSTVPPDARGDRRRGRDLGRRGARGGDVRERRRRGHAPHAPTSGSRIPEGALPRRNRPHRDPQDRRRRPGRLDRRPDAAALRASRRWRSPTSSPDRPRRARSSEYGAEVLHIMRDQSFEHEAALDRRQHRHALGQPRPEPARPERGARGADARTPTSSSTASAAAVSSGWASASTRSPPSARASST